MYKQVRCGSKRDLASLLMPHCEELLRFRLFIRLHWPSTKHQRTSSDPPGQGQSCAQKLHHTANSQLHVVFPQHCQNKILLGLFTGLDVLGCSQSVRFERGSYLGFLLVVCRFTMPISVNMACDPFWEAHHDAAVCNKSTPLQTELALASLAQSG